MGQNTFLRFTKKKKEKRSSLIVNFKTTSIFSLFRFLSPFFSSIFFLEEEDEEEEEDKEEREFF